MDPLIAPLRKKLLEFQQKRNAVMSRMAADQATLSDLNGAINGIEAILKIEGALESPTPTQVQIALSTVPAKNGRGQKLADLLKKELSDKRPRALPDLVSAVQSQGYDFAGKRPEKAVNFTLMGIANGKKIERVGPDLWRMTA
jgi:hypothetical protein